MQHFPPVIPLQIPKKYLTGNKSPQDLMSSILLKNIPWYEYSARSGPDYCTIAKQGEGKNYRIPRILQNTAGIEYIKNLPEKERVIYLINDLSFISTELCVPALERQ